MQVTSRMDANKSAVRSLWYVWCAANRCKAKKRVKSLQDEIRMLRQQNKRLQGQQAKSAKRKAVQKTTLWRHKRRINTLLQQNKDFKAEITNLRNQHGVGIQHQRKGKSPRSHMTLAAKALTLDALSAAGCSPQRWQGLCGAFGTHLVAGEHLDLRPCSDRTARRLIDLDDMICLLFEGEMMQSAKGRLQFMCDISPLLKRKCTLLSMFSVAMICKCAGAAPLTCVSLCC